MKRTILFIILALCSLWSGLHAQDTMGTAYDFGLMLNGYGRNSSLNTANYTYTYGQFPTNDVYYRFQTNEPLVATISHCGSQIGDTYVYLLTDSGHCLGESGSSDTGLCSSTGMAHLKVNYLPAGVYYVVSKGKTANGYISTTVQVNSLAYRDPIDVGTKSGSFTYTDTQNTTQFGNSYVGRSTNDVTYKFTLTVPMSVTISHCGSSVSDTYLSLLDVSKNRIAYNDDYSGAGACSNTSQSYLKVDLPAGTYYAISEGYSQNGYITTSIQGAPAEAVVDIGTKSDVFTYSHTQDTNACTNAYEGRPTKDVTYKLTLTVPMTVTLSHCGSALSDTYLSLLDASQNLLAFNNDYTGEGACTNTQQAYLRKELAAGTYYIVSEGYSQNGTITTSIQATRPYDKLAASPDQNYILTLTPTVASQSATDLTVEQCLQQLQYFDGLGRPLQAIQRSATPSKGDLVTYQEYDPYGRDYRSWLPSFAAANSGAFISLSGMVGKAAMTYSGDGCPYSLTAYELSPLNRIVDQRGPGQDWDMNGKSVKTTYRVNTAANSNNTYKDAFNCIVFALDEGSVRKNVYSAAGNYYVTQTIDEDGRITYEFKDKLGQLVLTRQMDGSTAYSTYYVYDNSGNLRYALPPKAADVFETTTSAVEDSHDAMQKYAYIYKYDGFQRCIYKKLPGCDPVYYIYDQGGRLIFSQDGEQRNNGEWAFTIPDVFGRVVLSGTCKNSLSYTAAPLKDVLVKATWGSVTNSYMGYTLAGITLTNPVVLSAAYYDHYDFISKNSVPSTLGYTTATGYGTRATATPKGMPTGTVTARLASSGTSGYLYAAIYYDQRGRMIQSKSTSHLTGGLDEEYLNLTFTGQPKNRKLVHTATGKTTQTEVYTYDYDHAGRLKTTKHKLNTGTEVTLADNTYDDLGRLKTNQKHTHANLKTTFGYNIRSWVTSVNSPVFNQTLYYNDSYAGNTKQYGGNISAMDWYIWGEYETKGYTFGYDGLSRLTAANYMVNGTANNNYKTSYTYDSHGNISSLQRYGKTSSSANGLVDNLTMTYAGNQLLSVSDGVGTISLPESGDFKNYTNAATEYTYNKNGALTKDLNKGISVIQYNSLNLPTLMDIKSPVGEARNEYVYSADGRKLQVVQKWNPNYSTTPVIGSAVNTASLTQSKTTDYVGNKVYENNVLKRTLIDGGYIEGSTYYFYVTDHLGNNRATVNSSGTVIQKLNYYPFGMTFASTSSADQDIQPYKYNGKELDRMHGLNLYDYSARYYEPALGRFTTMDPLAEKYYSVSPYAYCMNNPLRFVDLNGKDFWDFVKGTAQSLVHNLSWGIVSGDAGTVSNANHYNAGRTVGDAISAVIGIKETVEGSLTAIGGAAVTVLSGGTTTIVSVPATVGGTIEAAHGIGTVVTAIKSVVTGEGRVSQASSSNGSEKSNTSSGNKNSPHANQKAKEAAGQKYQDAKSQYDDLKSKPNKTPEEKKQLDSYKKQMNHWKEKQDFSGENHNQNAKGNR